MIEKSNAEERKFYFSLPAIKPEWKLAVFLQVAYGFSKVNG
jgi:hypothetical protein